MAPRKRKSSKAAVEEEEKQAIVVDFQDIGAKIKETAEALEKAEENTKKDQSEENKPDKGEKIKQNVDKVKTMEGIIGYILRNAKSASIDLKDPSRIIDYAVLSSSSLEASEELSNNFELGDVKHVLIEGNDVKLISLIVDGNKVSVFMEKAVDHKRIYKDLLK